MLSLFNLFVLFGRVVLSLSLSHPCLRFPLNRFVFIQCFMRDSCNALSLSLSFSFQTETFNIRLNPALYAYVSFTEACYLFRMYKCEYIEMHGKRHSHSESERETESVYRINISHPFSVGTMFFYEISIRPKLYIFFILPLERRNMMFTWSK